MRGLGVWGLGLRGLGFKVPSDIRLSVSAHQGLGVQGWASTTTATTTTTTTSAATTTTTATTGFSRAGGLKAWLSFRGFVSSQWLPVLCGPKGARQGLNLNSSTPKPKDPKRGREGAHTSLSP